MDRLLPLVLCAALACASGRGAAPRPAEAAGDPLVLHAPELARVRCLLVAPFENGSDAPLAADAATDALVGAVGDTGARAMPLGDLRALFKDTALELPAGMGPSLALELADLVGADAALHGSVEGRAQEASPELVVTLRLTLAGDRRLVYAHSIVVNPVSGERADSAVRRGVLAATQPVLARLGSAGAKRCFDPARAKALRNVALVVSGEKPRAAPAPAARAPRGARTPRQADWARRLAAGERIVVEDLAFSGRSAELQRDGGLADLAGALAETPGAVRLEGFVDATSDRADDQRLSAAMAQAAATRLGQLGVPRQRLTSTGRGGESPLVPNFTARGRAANRRVEVSVAK
jgi:outer membrane protein OmpA-like peptidoglycan-associated protein